MKISLNTPEVKRKHRESTLKIQERLKTNNTFKYYNTKPELEMEKILIELDIKYEKQKSIWDINHCYSCDFFLYDINTVVEVDGKYWHNYPNHNEIDLIRNKELEAANYKIIRFWEDEININSVKERLLQCPN